MAPPERAQLLGVALANPLFAGTSALRTPLDPYGSGMPSRSPEEAAEKGFVLGVLAQKEQLNTPPAHLSQPRATSSESLRPPSTEPASTGRAVTTPVASRAKSRPRSAPR